MRWRIFILGRHASQRALIRIAHALPIERFAIFRTAPAQTHECTVSAAVRGPKITRQRRINVALERAQHANVDSRQFGAARLKARVLVGEHGVALCARQCDEPRVEGELCERRIPHVNVKGEVLGANLVLCEAVAAGR